MPPKQRRGGGKPDQGRDVTVSKALSYLLRHAAEREGLKMNAQGYANVADVVGNSHSIPFHSRLEGGGDHEKKQEKRTITNHATTLYWPYFEIINSSPGENSNP